MTRILVYICQIIINQSADIVLLNYQDSTDGNIHYLIYYISLLGFPFYPTRDTQMLSL